MPEEAEPPAIEEEAQIRESRKLISKSRESIEDGKRHFSDSFDLLAESQKLLRRLK